MNPRQLEALRAISHAPRTMNHFTAEGFLSPNVAKLYLDDLVLEGYVTEPPKQHGSYAITDAGAARARKVPILPEFFTVTGRSVYTKYLQQERVAKDRGIAWEFSFDEWCRVWHESGKWARRGRAGDAYVMARFGDVGPYSPANVEIITLRQNSRDFQLNKTRRLSASAASFSAPEAVHT
jgi:hypothetical protein